MKFHLLNLRDFEDLKPHYSLTLRHWLDRFIAAKDFLVSRYDDLLYRRYLLYLTGSKVGFEHGDLHLFQFIFTLPDTSWYLNERHRHQWPIQAIEVAVP